jgi:SAM-dependent methyltransferase
MSNANGNTPLSIASDPHQACPVCGHESFHAAWRYREHAVHRCGQCGLEYTGGMRAASLAFYQSQYSAAVTASLAAGQVHPGYGLVVETLARIRRQYLSPSQRRALDVGCGAGYLLSRLAALGFEAEGIDFDPELVAFARAHYQAQASVARLEDLGSLSSSFDLALLIHVLEHVEQPLALLRDLAQVLVPGGSLLVEVPNADRFALRRSLRRGELEWGEYPPHHLTFWNAASLRWALQAAGYIVVECGPRPFSRDDRLAAYFGRARRLPAGIEQRALRLAGWLGDAAGLQGDTVVAIARRPA